MPYKNLPESEWGRMDKCVEKVQGQGHDKQSAIAICYTSIAGKEYQAAPEMERVGNQYRVFDANSGVTFKQVDSAREAMTLLEEYKATADINNLPDSAFLHIESGGKKDDQGKTVPRSLRHLPYKTADGGIDLPKLRNALSRLGQSNTGTSGGDTWLTASLRDSLRAKAEGILKNNTDAESAKKEREESMLDRVLGFFRSDKEGKRNAANDQEHLNQAHDHLVAAGAECPMVYKQANGSYRWVLLSSNSYQDRDKEIVSQAAQEADVDRMNEAHDYGPLRLWHLGYPDMATKEAGPGVDIGVCDFSQMFGRIRVESGTFTDNRIAAAIKGRADQWLSSIGFFHPLDQPDQDGVYHDSYTFERSLLPRQYASNPLTPLAAIQKEQEMTTKEEKVKQLSTLLGDPALAETVLKQAEKTEKEAEQRGLAYKGSEPHSHSHTHEDGTTHTHEHEHTGDHKHSHAAGKAKRGEEGSAEEEETEPKKEAEEEGDIEKNYKAMAKGLAPHLVEHLAPHMEKMIKEHMAEHMKAHKERAEKEASIGASVAAIDAALKETRKIVDVLNADLPKGVKRYLASEAEDTVVKDAGKYKDMQAPPPNPLGEIFNWLAQPTGVPPVQPSPEK